MKLAEARALRPGDKVRCRVTVPGGADPWERPCFIPEVGYQRDDIPAGTVLVFERVIAKIRVLLPPYPWSDRHEEMLFCTWRPGQRAWLNIANAARVREGA